MIPPPRVTVLGLALLAGCAPSAPVARPSAAPAVTPSPLPLHVVSDGNGTSTILTEMKRGRRLYTVRARSFVGDSNTAASASGSGTFDMPQITFGTGGADATVADAPKAVIDGADKSVLMTGGVRARSQDGNVLHCDRLRYNGRTERVHGEGNVQLATPSGLVLRGDTLDGNTRLQDVIVRRRT